MSFILHSNISALQVEIINSPTHEEAAYSGSYSDSRAGEIWIGVARADGAKCERCWNYSTQVGSFVDHPTLCARCYSVLDVQQPLPAAAVN